MSNGDTIQRLDIVELRLFIEELACNICRFMHVSQDGVEPQSVRIKQEVQLGTPNAFADIVVRAPGMAPYIVEVDMVIPWSTSPKACCESTSENWAGSSRFRSSFSYSTVTIIPMTRC